MGNNQSIKSQVLKKIIPYKMRTILLALLAVAIRSDSDLCNEYISTPTIKTDYCAVLESTADPVRRKILLHACPAGKVCSLNVETTAEVPCVSIPPVANRMPGEYCTADSDCYTNSCTNHKCKGEAAGAGCNDDRKCNPGLCCTKKDENANEPTCEPVVNEAGKECGDTGTKRRCGPHYVCNSGECVKYGSIPVGSDKVITMATACASMTAEGPEGAKKCVRGRKLSEPAFATEPPLCPANNKCFYKNYEDETKEEPCACGFSTSGHKYCVVHSGDFSFTDAINFRASVNPNEQHIVCAPICQLKATYKDMGKEFLQSVLASKKQLSWHHFLDNPSIIKDVSYAHSDYWSLVKDLEDAEDSDSNTMLIIIAIAAGVVVVIAIIIIVICCRKRGKTDDALMGTYN